MSPSEVQQLVQELERTGALSTQLTQRTVAEMSKSLARYFTEVSSAKIKEFTDKAQELANAALKTEQDVRTGQALTTTVGESPATARGQLMDFIKANTTQGIGETMNMDFFLRIARQVAEGAGQHLARNFDEARVDEFPALEFKRVYDRLIPRGSEKDPAGPTNAWNDPDGRWVAAAEESGDEDAQRIFEDTGRCVALKSSGIWSALGDGSGGYEDTLGNDFPPFAFSSGWDVDEITREEAEELGLLDPGEGVEMPKLDFSDLLGIPSS